MNDNDICFELDQNAVLDYYCTRSIHQQYAERHVPPLGHIIRSQSQLVPENGESDHSTSMLFVYEIVC